MLGGEAEGLAEEAYARAGLDPEAPHVPRLVRALLGPASVVRGPRPVHAPAALYRLGDRWRIVVGRHVPSAYALHALAHELGHYLLRGAGLNEAEEEAAADYLGACLIAPRPAYRAALRSLGPDVRRLAEAFGTTETGAALRVGEVTGRPLVVVAPHRVRVRGPEEWAWPDEATLRAWARRARPGLRKTKLRDDPRRVVLEPLEDIT